MKIVRAGNTAVFRQAVQNEQITTDTDQLPRKRASSSKGHASALRLVHFDPFLFVYHSFLAVYNILAKKKINKNFVHSKLSFVYK